MAERIIDGSILWTGAEQIGSDADWVATIGVRSEDGTEFHVHSLDEAGFSRDGQAFDYAAERLRAIQGIGPELDLIF